MVKWLTTIKRGDETAFTVEKMVLDDEGFPQPTGEFETIEADTLVLALGQDVDLSLLENVPGLAIENGVVKVDSQHDDRISRNLCRRRHGPGGTHRHRRRRARQEGSAQHRRVAAWPRPHPARKA